MVPPVPMFGGFTNEIDPESGTRYAITGLIAAIVLAAAGGAVWAWSGGEPEQEEEEPDVIDVSFEAIEEEPIEVAPPPPPPPASKPPPTDRPPSKPTTIKTAPTRIAEQELRKEDPSKHVPEDTGGGGGEMTAGPPGGDVGGLGGMKEPKKEVKLPPPPKPEKKVAKTGPIALPEEATPPKPLAGNTPPAYPDAARAAGMEGVVFLKIVINEDGSVGAIEVKKGDEPFVSAAVAAVKTWKYSPALVDGKPTAVYRIIKVPFKLKS